MVESSDNDGYVHKYDSSSRDSTVTESFQLVKGASVAFVLFEKFPIWLLALSPFAFKCICFVHYSSLEAVMAVSDLSNVVIKWALTIWDNKCFLFKGINLPSPNFVLISGSNGFIKSLDLLAFETPVVTTSEHRFKSSIKIRGIKSIPYQHALNGGCTSSRQVIGFLHCQPPPKLTKIQRKLKDFIDFSSQPDEQVDPDNISSLDCLRVDSTPTVFDLSKRVLLPSYRFSTGWGIRHLTRKECFNLLGYGAIIDSNVSVPELLTLIPIQPLALTLIPFFTALPPSSRIQQTVPSIVPSAISTCTYFEAIDTTISDDWTLVLDNTRSTKEDKAPVPSELWDARLFASFNSANQVARLVAGLRDLCICRYRRNITTSFLHFLRTTFHTEWSDYVSGSRLSSDGGNLHQINQFNQSEMGKSIKAGREVIEKACDSTWFEWKGGSTLIFWRWPCFCEEARDGFDMFITQKGLRDTAKRVNVTSPPTDPRLRALFVEKLRRMIEAKYFEEGWSRWDIRCFGVPKGLDDIRLVFDGTSSGVNQVVYIPSFFLATAWSLYRILVINAYQCDLDAGEFFLNCPLHLIIRAYCGVNLSRFDEFDSISTTRRHRQCRTWMGFKPSPYLAVRYLSLAVEVAIGDPQDVNNPFHWDQIKLNLPSSETFDPSRPWVYKWNNQVQAIAGDLVSFMDDFRFTGYSVENCWQCARRVSSRLQFLGMQEAARKRQPPSLTPGPWAGTVVHANGVVTKSITQEKWNRVKTILKELRTSMGTKEHPKVLNHKKLERDRGFLNYLGMTYDIIIPFLRGFHNTIDQWRDGRNIEGWKADDGSSQWGDILDHYVFTGKLSQEEAEALIESQEETDKPPKFVLPVPRLFDDVTMLERIFERDTPANFPIRHSKTAEVFCGFFDASGTGFGSTMQGKDTSKLTLRIGVWSCDIESERSSNWKEFGNAVKGIRKEAKAGNLHHALLFICTDNSTVEGAVTKGNSPSEHLFELVVDLKSDQMRYEFMTYVIHVSGNRMIRQGTDGVSRGDMSQALSVDKPIRELIPIDVSALDRCEGLTDWLKSWVGKSALFLEPAHWFLEGHDIRFDKSMPLPRAMLHESGTYIWTPPPAIADVAIEQLRYARLKRQKSLHIILIPRLFVYLWRKQLCKASDLVMTIPVGLSFWPCHMCEPLLIAFCFPFSRFDPWCARGTPKLCAVERKLQEMWGSKNLDGRSVLRELRMELAKLPTMPQHVVRSVLFFEH